MREHVKTKTNRLSRQLVEIAEGDFEAEVLQAKQPVLVWFWTPWSRPCRVIEAVLSEVASAWESKAKVVKINADDSLELSIYYDIQSVPTLLFFVGGKPCVRIVGTASKEAILAKLTPFAATS